MAFAAATTEKVLTYLGFSFDSGAIAEVEGALAGVSATTQAAAAETRIEAWLAQLDAINASINVQREVDDSGLLPQLYREGRRHVELVANALSLPKRLDIFGTSGT